MNSSFYVEYDPKIKMKSVFATGPWDESISTYIGDKKTEGLCLNYAKGWDGTDLSFLEGLKHLKRFEIVDWDIEDISAINSLRNLIALKIFTYCNTKIEFRNFPKLEKCAFEWRSRCSSLFSCKTIDSLFLSGYSGKSFEPFTNLQNLNKLVLKGSKLLNLDGIQYRPNYPSTIL